tara:strand:+ start:20 stop:565 length:546 start_codon:yes stop_codon:yes gene_type:complete
MGQFGNQPDFITNDIQTVTPVLAANLTAADSLNGSVLYVGTSAPGNLQVIPTGTVGPSVVTALSSPGYAGSGGTGYDDNGNECFVSSDGSYGGLCADFTAVNGVVNSVTITDFGAGYLNGDLVTLDAGDGNAVFRVVAAPGLPTAAQAITFTNVVQGEWFPVVVDYVLSDLTTVTNLIAGK